MARFGAEIAGGEAISPTDILFLSRLGGQAVFASVLRLILPVLIFSMVADIVKMLVVDRPWESPDDKRRAYLRELYGETEGEARWQKEFNEREIQIDLSGERA